MAIKETLVTEAKDNLIVRILEECDRDIDEAMAEIMRRDAWLIRHAVRRGLEAVQEADNEATRQKTKLTWRGDLSVGPYKSP
jgi:hypothetical protein